LSYFASASPTDSEGLKHNPYNEKDRYNAKIPSDAVFYCICFTVSANILHPEAISSVNIYLRLMMNLYCKIELVSTIILYDFMKLNMALVRRFLIKDGGSEFYKTYVL
jgi:hypothetical protein